MYQNKMLEMINKSKSTFHAVHNIKNELIKAGYVELYENETWKLDKNKYFVCRNNSSIIAFNIGSDLSNYSFNIVASHTDSPAYKLKPNFEIETKAGNKLNTEGYGGMLNATWFDRPLSIAGRCFVNDNGIKEILVDLDQTLLIIPSLL